MTEQKRENYYSYTKPGEFEILEMQCEKCSNKISNPMVCKKFQNRKPSHVLKCEGECSEFIQKNNS